MRRISYIPLTLLLLIITSSLAFSQAYFFLVHNVAEKLCHQASQQSLASTKKLIANLARVFDGRNILDKDTLEDIGFEVFSIGK